MRRLWGALLVAAAALAPVGGVASPALAANTLVVGASSASCPGATYPSIGAAVDDASDGDTIRVCAGDYIGRIDDTGKDLTFLGARAGVDGRDRTPDSDEALVAPPNGDPVVLTGASTVDGFALSGPAQAVGVGADLSGNQTLRNCVIENVIVGAEITGPDVTFGRNGVDLARNSAKTPGTGVVLPPGGGANSSIADNAFRGNLGEAAVAVNQTSAPVDVDQLSVTNNSAELGNKGAFAELAHTTNLALAGNTVTSASVNPDPSILLDGANRDFSIRDNAISGGSFDGIEALPGGGGPDSGAITGNSIRGHEFGVLINGPVEDIAVLANTLRNNGIGLYYVSAQSKPVSSNVFFGNTRGVENALAPSLDVSGNFWGCNTGPDTAGCDTTGGGAIIGSPYLVLSSTIGSASVSVGQSTTFSADINHTNLGQTVTPPAPSGLGVAFSYDRGTVRPAGWTTTAGKASTTVRPSSAGSGTVTATLFKAMTSQPFSSTPVQPRITIHDAGTNEGNTGTHVLNFPVTLNLRTTVPTTVHFTTASGSAVAGSDFIGKTGTITIPAGQTSRTIPVTIKGDRIREASETFGVNISSPSIGTVAGPLGIGTIRNDD